MAFLRYFAIFCVLNVCLIGKVRSLENHSPGVCETSECHYMASIIRNRSDLTVNPCDDFYDYACGGFINKTELPQGVPILSQFSILQIKVINQLKNIVEEEISKGDQLALKLIKGLYRSCVNESEIEKFDLTSIKSFFDGLGGWPVISPNWTEAQFTWYDTLYKFREMGLESDFLVKFLIDADLKNSSTRIIHFDAPKFGISEAYLKKGENDSNVKDYYDYMVNVTVTLGANRTLAEQEMKEVVRFEVQLANDSYLDGDRSNMSTQYNKMTIGNLSVLHPSIPWLQYSNRMLAPFHNVTADEPIIVYAPKYMGALAGLLNRTSNRTISNYLMWRSLDSINGYLNSQLRKSKLGFTSKSSGSSVEPPRPSVCLDKVKERLPLALGYIYVYRFFDKESKNATVEFVTGLRNEFESSLDNISWLDNTTRKYAKIKADGMKYVLAYPDELENVTLVNGYYKSMNLAGKSYLEVMLAIDKFNEDKEVEGLKKPSDYEDWVSQSNAAEVNGFYFPEKNEIKITASLLQGIIFNSTRPKYLSFGGIGFIIAHEISHGFDSTGRQYDGKGNVMDWWLPETEQKYNNLSQCFFEQYDKIRDPTVNITLNGKLNLQENIADNGAVKQSYRAYLNWVRHNGEEQTLPGLNYTTRQLYWLMSANVLCLKLTDQFLKTYIETNPHAAPKYRINVPFGNTDDFARDWNCSAGTPMNPVKKCSLW